MIIRKREKTKLIYYRWGPMRLLVTEQIKSTKKREESIQKPKKSFTLWPFFTKHGLFRIQGPLVRVGDIDLALFGHGGMIV